MTAEENRTATDAEERVTGDHDGSDNRAESDGPRRPDTEKWPVDLVGVTESIVTTLGPNERWNVAPLGLSAGSPVTATTWGNTRTRRNFDRRGEGYVQFAYDPELFVEAALGIYERDDPILPEADAWAKVTVERVERGEGEDGTRWERWSLRPVESAVRARRPRTTNRGYYAVIEATVAASRLDVDAYDTETLIDRLHYFEDVVERCGGPVEHRAFERLIELLDRPELR